MSVDVIFIGFVGSRFTLHFSQGYFSSMINVGVKVMVLYISSVEDANEHETFADAYMLSGLAQVAPREIGQLTVVEVRISNPDKL